MTGICGIIRKEHPGPLSVSYAFDPQWWGRGLATLSVGHSLNFVSEKCRSFEAIARVFPENVASVKILGRYGFVEQAKERDTGPGVPWKLIR